MTKLPDERTSADFTDEVLSAVLQHLDAFNRRDIDALCAGLAHDVVFVTGADLVTGRDQACRFFEEALAGSVDLFLDLQRAIVQGDTVACELRESITTQGVTRDEPIAAFYTVQQGLLTNVKVYREGSADLTSE